MVGSPVCCSTKAKIEGDQLTCSNTQAPCTGKWTSLGKNGCGKNCKKGDYCYVCSPHLQDLNLRSGLAHKLTPPFTVLSWPGPNGLKVADICVVKGYPRSDIHHLTFNEDTF